MVFDETESETRKIKTKAKKKTKFSFSLEFPFEHRLCMQPAFFFRCFVFFPPQYVYVCVCFFLFVYLFIYFLFINVVVVVWNTCRSNKNQSRQIVSKPSFGVFSKIENLVLFDKFVPRRCFFAFFFPVSFFFITLLF